MSQTIPITKKTITIGDVEFPIVQGDFIDQWKFTIPSTYDGIDLSTGFTFYCKYVLKSGVGDLTELTQTVEGDNINLLWVIPANALSEKGPLKIQIVGISDTIVWQSLFAVVNVNEQLQPSGEEFTVTYLETYLQKFNEKIIEAGEQAQAIIDENFEVVTISGADYLTYNY
jgi:hypothetical protein